MSNKLFGKLLNRMGSPVNRLAANKRRALFLAPLTFTEPSRRLFDTLIVLKLLIYESRITNNNKIDNDIMKLASA